MKKTTRFVTVATLMSAAAYVAYRYKNLEPREERNNVEKKLITLDNEHPEEVKKYCDDESCEVIETNEVTYCFLKKGFINAINGQKEVFNHEYSKGTFIEVSHQIDFEDLKELIEFNNLTKDLSYKVDYQEELKTISLVKIIEIKNDETLVKEILEVADYAGSKGGFYQGYSISIV